MDARTEVQTVGVVTQVSPLLVRTGPSATACPADRLADVTLTLADPIQITVRTPRRPLVTGVVA